ncbi:MAG TPA: hypothetical protein VNI84_06300 [Pyrinomonadaceae bacterium]|nr:hypothetical protein [Pyrinomonadaceae bacterium]
MLDSNNNSKTNLQTQFNDNAAASDFEITDEIRASLKCGFVTRLVSSNLYAFAALSPEQRPRVGDIILGRVGRIGRHTKMDDCDGRRTTLLKNDLVVAAYGNRYATDQYEGVVPETTASCHILSNAAVCGIVKSKHAKMSAPTELEVIGFMRNAAGQQLNLRDFGLKLRTKKVTSIKSSKKLDRPSIVVVVGSSMNSGKTTATASIVRGLTQSGYQVAAGKITGTACGNDIWAYKDNGAVKVLDFSDCGYPSTYLCDGEEVLNIYRTLRQRLRKEKPDFIVMEVADGIVQRETTELLAQPEFKKSIDHLIYSASDALAAESGLRLLAQKGYEVAALTGLVSASALAKAEAEALVGVRCYTQDEIIAGELNELLKPQTPKLRKDSAASATEQSALKIVA